MAAQAQITVIDSERLPAFDTDERHVKKREKLFKQAEERLADGIPLMPSLFVDLHKWGAPCSEIDQRLRLKAGTAHAAVVAWWYDTKPKQRR